MNQLSLRHPSVHISKEYSSPVLDVFGPTVQFLAAPLEAEESHCVMQGVIPSGGVVPLHSHTGYECFFMLSGEQEVLVEMDGIYEWAVCSPGDFIQVPSKAKHAFRNLSSKPAVSLISTTAALGRFFEKVGRPVSLNNELMPPTPEAVKHFVDTAIRSGYWLATPEENAAVGLAFP